MAQHEIYVSTDIEADGPIPGEYSMLSFGSAAFTAEGVLLSTYTANLELLSGAAVDENTKQFWKENREAYNVTRIATREPWDVMPEYVKWLKRLPGRPIFVGYPAGFDFTFIYYYLMRFAGESPFGFACLDIKTYAMAVLGWRFTETAKRDMPRSWFSGEPHTHVALDDAIEQGRLFCNMLAFNKRTAEPPGVEVGETYIPAPDGNLVAFPSTAMQENGVEYVRLVDARGVELTLLHRNDFVNSPEETVGALLGFLKQGKFIV